MSELKVYHCNEWHNEYTEFYQKSEADKVIAEKDEELRHNKYNRCLAMARWCLTEAKVSDDEYRMYWWVKWQKRWLELADKFKEAK